MEGGSREVESYLVGSEADPGLIPFASETTGSDR